MNAAQLSVIALGLIASGVSVTWLIATRLPMGLLTTAARSEAGSGAPGASNHAAKRRSVRCRSMT